VTELVPSGLDVPLSEWFAELDAAAESAALAPKRVRRRLLRSAPVDLAPREGRPSRARRARLPEALRQAAALSAIDIHGMRQPAG
jgi:hypothetical protein